VKLGVPSDEFEQREKEKGTKAKEKGLHFIVPVSLSLLHFPFKIS